MANTGEKLPNGEAVREFYASLDMIEDYYWNKGYRKKAYLYRTLKENLGWRMSLESFKYHFKRAIEIKTIHPLPNNDKTIHKTIQNNKEIIPNTETVHENSTDDPIIPPSTISKGFNYKPNTTEKDLSKTI